MADDPTYTVFLDLRQPVRQLFLVESTARGLLPPAWMRLGTITAPNPSEALSRWVHDHTGRTAIAVEAQRAQIDSLAYWHLTFTTIRVRKDRP